MSKLTRHPGTRERRCGLKSISNMPTQAQQQQNHRERTQIRACDRALATMDGYAESRYIVPIAGDCIMSFGHTITALLHHDLVTQ